MRTQDEKVWKCVVCDSTQSGPATTPRIETLKNIELEATLDSNDLEQSGKVKDAHSTADISGKMGALLLKGWALMGENCPICCDVPLMRSKEKEYKCMRCERMFRLSKGIFNEITGEKVLATQKQNIRPTVPQSASSEKPVAAKTSQSISSCISKLVHALDLICERIAASSATEQLQYIRTAKEIAELMKTLKQMD